MPESLVASHLVESQEWFVGILTDWNGSLGRLVGAHIEVPVRAAAFSGFRHLLKAIDFSSRSPEPRARS